MLVAVLVLVVGASITSSVTAANKTAVVTIDTGKLQGLVVVLNNTGGAKARRYLGVPFALAERFQAPKPPKSWEGIKDMNNFGKVCPQTLGAFSAPSVEDISEDCLNLNVFVPDDASMSNPLPVLVWIYGGGFGIGNNRYYDGSYIAALGKVVVVVINYRVSVFGFLSNGEGGDIKGNYGLRDQIEALKWVNRNIARFNGNPNKVTIFGESAGGVSVSLLLLTKHTEGLFQRAIPQSGDASSYWSAPKYSEVVPGVKSFAKTVGCSDDLSKLKDCLSKKELMKIVNASIALAFPTLTPIGDDKTLFEAPPSELYRTLQFEKRDVMLGVTDDEGTVFTNAAGSLGDGYNVTNGVTRETFVAILRGGGLKMVIPDPKSPLINTTIYRYTDWSNITSPIRNRRLFVDLQGDIAFVAPAIRGAEAYVKKKASTYFYSFQHRFDDVMGFKIAPWVRSYHGAELLFLFGSPIMSDPGSTNANFSREIIAMWTNFAKSGNPNKPEAISLTWPEYNLEEQKYMTLKPKMEVQSHLRADYMAYWNWLVPSTPQKKPMDSKPVQCSVGTRSTTAIGKCR